MNKRGSGKKVNSVNVQKSCPSGFYMKGGKCVQAGVGKEYKP